MSDPYVGEIRMFGGNFAPINWALCQGQIQIISDNDALFNLIGTTYGGDGQSTFGLPNLQSRAPIHMGQGPGLSNRIIGEFSGAETISGLQTTGKVAGSGTSAYVANVNSGALVAPFLAINYIISLSGIYPTQ